MLGEILDKLGGWDKMTEAEKQTYQVWQRILSQPDVTIDDLKKIIPAEITRAEGELEEYRNEPKKDIYLKAWLRALRFLNTAICGPQQRREELQAKLKKQFGI